VRYKTRIKLTYSIYFGPEAESKEIHGPYVGVDYNLTYVQSTPESTPLKHIYHGIPMPESTLSSSQGLLI
jgi:hypothetical protein